MKINFISICLIVFLIAAVYPGYSASESTSIDNRIISANRDFGFKLFAEIIRQSNGKNIFISPSSISIALTMAYNGAGGETQEAMAKTLELKGFSLEEVNKGNAILKGILENPDPRVELTIANSLWGKKGIEFKEDFIKRNKEFYGAEVSNLDFSSPDAPVTINDWVSKKTRGKIDKIVESISNDTILFLINAIYFKGKWAQEFDKNKTREDVFYLSDGRQKKHPMMSQSGKYFYYKGTNFQAVSLPYGEGKVSMYIFLPDKDSNLKEFYENLNTKNWDNWMPQFRKTEGDITIPRFKLEYETELNDTLTGLGMGIAFDRGRADFDKMLPIPPNVFISRIKHKTYVDVNEEGTEAAGVTSVEMTATSVELNPEKFTMIADHPFFCTIRDNQTGTLLFMGSIEEPK